MSRIFTVSRSGDRTHLNPNLRRSTTSKIPSTLFVVLKTWKIPSMSSIGEPFLLSTHTFPRRKIKAVGAQSLVRNVAVSYQLASSSTTDGSVTVATAGDGIQVIDVSVQIPHSPPFVLYSDCQDLAFHPASHRLAHTWASIIILVPCDHADWHNRQLVGADNLCDH